MTLDDYMAARADRCPTCQHHAPTQGHGRACSPIAPSGVDDAYPTFVTHVRRAVREDGTVHACDLRPVLRDVIPPRTLSACWRRAKSSRPPLLVEVGIERSDDHKGRNAGRPEPYYRLAA